MFLMILREYRHEVTRAVKLLISMSLVISLCLFFPVHPLRAQEGDLNRCNAAIHTAQFFDTAGMRNGETESSSTYESTVSSDTASDTVPSDDPLAGNQIIASEFLVAATLRGVSLVSRTIPERRNIPAASKLMTAVIALEALPADTAVPVTKKAQDLDKKSSSPISLKEDQKYSVKYLVSAILLRNSDAAAITLAEYISDDEESFVERMNETAKNLSMNDTHFTNTSGQGVLFELPLDREAGSAGDPFTTVSDLSLLFRYALNLSTFRDIFTEYSFLQFQEDGKPLSLSSSLLSAWGIEEIRGASLFSASSTDSLSETCVLALAQKGDLEVILIASGIPDQSAYQTLHDLVLITFSNFEVTPLVEEGDAYRAVVVGGVNEPVDAVFRNTVLYAHPIGQSFSIPVSEFIPSVLTTLPIKKGDVLGQVRLTLEDGTQVTTEVVAAQNMTVNENLLTFAGKLIDANRNIGYLIIVCCAAILLLAIRGGIRRFMMISRRTSRK